MTRDQRELIASGDWRTLAVLDACRFDVFEDRVDGYLEGDLEPVRSPVDPSDGIATSEWCKATFREPMEDVVYVSSTPHVNSRTPVRGFDGAATFHEVVDVWATDWDDAIGTVRPEAVTEAAVDVAERYPGKRVIVHYMQPHYPYLDLEAGTDDRSNAPADREGLRRTFRRVVSSRVRRLLGGRLTRWLLRTAGLPAPTAMHEVLRRHGHDGLVRAYEANLDAALASLAALAGALDVGSDLVVTADHGEHLGEDGFYGHSYLPSSDVLTVVPWFRVSRSDDRDG